MFIDCFFAFFMPLEELDDEIRLVNWPTCNASLIPSSKNHSQGASTGRSPIRQIARTPLSSDAPFTEVAKREKRPALRATVQMTRRIYNAGVIQGSERYFLSFTHLFFFHRSWPIRARCIARRKMHESTSTTERSLRIFLYLVEMFLIQRHSTARVKSASSSYAHAFELLFIRVSFRRNISAVLCVLERLVFAIPCRISVLLSFLRYRSWQTTALC